MAAREVLKVAVSAHLCKPHLALAGWEKPGPAPDLRIMHSAERKRYRGTPLQRMTAPPDSMRQARGTAQRPILGAWVCVARYRQGSSNRSEERFN